MSTQQQITTCLACESELTADNFCPTCEGWPTAHGKGILKVLPGGGQSIRNITSEILALGDEALAAKLEAERTAMAAQIAAKEEKLQAEIAEL